MKAALARFLSEEEGASLIEYVLILALVVLVSAGILLPSNDTSKGQLPRAVGNHFDAKAAPLNPAGK